MLKFNGPFTVSKKDLVPVDDESYNSEDCSDLADLAALVDEDADDNNNEEEEEDEDEYDVSDSVEVKRGDPKFWAVRGKKDEDFWATRSGFNDSVL